MDDLISRQAAIDAVDDGAELIRRALDNMDVVGGERSKYEWGLGLLELCIDELNGLPSAERKGKWLYHEVLDVFECSVCGRQMVRNIFDYCPWCGARMERKEE